MKKIKDLSIYGNKNLYQLEGIIDLININELDSLELDLLHYPEVESLKNELMKMVNCDFVEVVKGEKTVSYTSGQVQVFHNKCLKIVDDIKKVCYNKTEKIIGIEKYLAEKVTYDKIGANSKNRAFYDHGKKYGKNDGTNSAYNGIMFGSCVCEGYTRAMQYLLRISDIKTENVYCVAGANRIKIRMDYHNVIELPDDGYHSIIRIDDVDLLYCDPCWDSSCYHNGNKTLPYCLLTKEEISRDHTLSFEENNVSNNHIKIPREYIKNSLVSISLREQSVLNAEEDIQIRR